MSAVGFDLKFTCVLSGARKSEEVPLLSNKSHVFCHLARGLKSTLKSYSEEHVWYGVVVMLVFAATS